MQDNEHVEALPARPTVVTLADVKPERPTWLWSHRIPRGKLTLLVGDPESGKSTLAVDTAARVTTGRPFPDGSRTKVGDVVYCTLEDGLADTLRPRLDAAGADPKRVHSITSICDPNGQERGLSLPEDLHHVYHVVRARGVQLVVFDPVKGYMTSGTNEVCGEMNPVQGTGKAAKRMGTQTYDRLYEEWNREFSVARGLVVLTGEDERNIEGEYGDAEYSEIIRSLRNSLSRLANISVDLADALREASETVEAFEKQDEARRSKAEQTRLVEVFKPLNRLSVFHRSETRDKAHIRRVCERATKPACTAMFEAVKETRDNVQASQAFVDAYCAVLSEDLRSRGIDIPEECIPRAVDAAVPENGGDDAS